MAKLEFNIDNPRLPETDIIKYKDFGQVLKSFHAVKTPFWKNPWFIGGATVVSVSIAILITVFIIKNNTSQPADIDLNDELTQLNQPFVNPPFSELNSPYIKSYVDPVTGSTVNLPSGTVLHIPSGAFIKSDGSIPDGLVEIRFRQLNSPLDIFLAGIPVNFDSAGMPRNLLSSGVVDIRAFKDGQNIFLAPGKSIKVDLLSLFDGDQYKAYYLDTVKKEWVYSGTINTDPYQLDAGKINETEIDFVGPQVGATEVHYVPRKADGRKYIFTVKVDQSKFPELAGYQNILFEVNELYDKFDPILYSVRWTGAELERSSVPDNFILSLIRPDSTVKLLVYPVFEKENYEKAMEIYRKKSDELQKNSPEETSVSLEKENPVNLSEDADNIIMYGSLFPKVIRSFSINSLGVWSCDAPLAVDYLYKKASVEFNNIDDGSEILFKALYLADRGRNSLFRYEDSREFKYLPGARYLLWIVTTNGEMAVVPPDEFAMMIQRSDRPKFSVKIVDAQQGLALIRSYLGL